jgi:DNA-binding NtrC family response regulator
MKQIEPGVNVILVTGAKNDQRVQEVFDLGIKGFIEKPYTYPQLSHAVYNMIYKKGQGK